jgi:large-conductance mechanosensitive channel
VVIGTAFTALVRQFTESFITPLIAVFTGGGDRYRKPPEQELAEPTEAELLAEIHDLLRAAQRG